MADAFGLVVRSIRPNQGQTLDGAKRQSVS